MTDGASAGPAAFSYLPLPMLTYFVIPERLMAESDNLLVLPFVIARDGKLTTRRTGCPHSGQIVSGASLIFCMISKSPCAGKPSVLLVALASVWWR